MKTLDDYIRVIPDFPEPGVLFRDITTVFQDADGMQLAIDEMQKAVADLDFDVIVGAESRGFIYGAAMAYNLHKPLALARKKGKLPWKTESVDYDLEYGKATLEMHVDAIKPGQKVLLVDDLLATGGTVKAAAELIEKLGGVVLGSIGQLGIRWPVAFGAGSGIPVMNRQAAAFLLEAGCAFVTASVELTGKELETLTAGGAPIAVTVFGRTQLMLLHHCPARTALGLTDGHRECRMCDTGAADALAGNVLEDGMGHRFPLLRTRMPEGCRIRLMNGLPTEWTDRKGIRNPMVEMTTETAEETENVLRALETGTRTGMDATGGHWARAVE